MKSVLIIDDLSFVRWSIRNIITKHGYEVVCEDSNGKRGVELFENYHPDIVTMDFVVDDMNSMDALHKITKIDSDTNFIVEQH